MKIVTYNIHKGMDCDNKFTLNKIRKYLSSLDADIICLQEVLCYQFMILKKTLKMDGVFVANVVKPYMKYGICLLSKHKISTHKHLLLTSKKEQRGILSSNIISPIGEMNIINTHLGLDVDERYTQINEILNHVNTLVGATIICGDFNEENVDMDKFNDAAVITNNYNICTFKKSNTRIDYVFLDQDIDIYKYTVNKINLSDHYPVIVEIR